MRSATGESAQQPVFVTSVTAAGATPPAGTTADPMFEVVQPTAQASGGIVPVVGTNVTSLVVKSSAGNFYGGSMTAGAVAGFLIAYNATAAPASGAALTAGLKLYVAPVLANGFASIGGSNLIPDRFTTGIVLLFSTSDTTYTVPGTAALHMRGRAV